jgi:uroporphyrinogen-III synthase
VRVLVTRPAAQAADWALQLRREAIDAVALPLIGIASVADPAELHRAWHGLARQQLIVFVSPNAAEQFFARRPPGAAWPAALLAGSPGPGTTRVLVALGVPATSVVEPAADAAQFDSESLWLQLRTHDWRGTSALIVRGDGGREWLAQALQEAGAAVAHVAAYRRVAPVFDAPAAALLRDALDRPATHLWFFSSSEAIDNLVAEPLAAAAEWPAARAIATHPRIAARARQAGFVQVAEARPSLPAVVACIQSLRP